METIESTNEVKPTHIDLGAGQLIIDDRPYDFASFTHMDGKGTLELTEAHTE